MGIKSDNKTFKINFDAKKVINVTETFKCARTRLFIYVRMANMGFEFLLEPCSLLKQNKGLNVTIVDKDVKIVCEVSRN